MFCILAILIIGSAILCVTTKSIMRAATFLLFVLFGVAGIYFLLDYTFLGAAQISIYAGGITMMYIFAIQLVSKRTLQGLQEHIKGSRVLTGALAALIGFGTVMIVFFKNQLFDRMAMMSIDNEVPMDKIGQAMVGADKYQYVLPL
jgi:NADH:ubiquinone oxidoreductase subunit 6 (chain J)